MRNRLPPTLPVNLGLLLGRLLETLRSRLVNGEYTERGLARAVGISQPHMHHILKCRRALTSDVADSILATFGWSLADLLTTEELAQALLDRQAFAGVNRHVPVLKGRLSPSDPFPDWRDTAEWLAVRSSLCESVRHAALVEVGPDPALDVPTAFPAFALLAFDENLRAHIEPHLRFALLWRGAGYIRRIRRHGNQILVLGQETFYASTGPTRIELEGASLLQFVRARVLWLGPDPRCADPFPQSGSGLPAATAS